MTCYFASEDVDIVSMEKSAQSRRTARSFASGIGELRTRATVTPTRPDPENVYWQLA